MLYTSLPISSHRTTTVSDYGVIFLLKCRARKTDVKKMGLWGKFIEK